MSTFLEQLFEGLAPEEQDCLRSIYGVEASSLTYGIEALEPLTEAEQKLFNPKSFISPYLSLQHTYKLRGNLSPVRFNGAVFGLFQTQKPLRTNYCQLPQRTVKVVFRQRRQQPEIIYRNLSHLDPDELANTSRKLSEAEMRCSFDLATAPLIRFLVLKISAKDYTVVVTGLQLAMAHLDWAAILASMPDLKEVDRKRDIKTTAQPRTPVADVNKYWQKVLEDLPERPMLPHFINSPNIYEQETYRAVIPSEITDIMQEYTGGDMEKTISLLQLAWGLLLQEVNRSSDTYFLLLSTEQHEAGRSFMSMIPVRLKCPEKELVESARQRLSRQVALSKPFSCYEGHGLDDLLEKQHNLFSHYLNFHALLSYAASDDQEETSYEQVWDSRGLPLGIYFQPSEQRIALTILYNHYSFRDGAVRELTDRYFLTLKTLLSHLEQPIALLKERLTKRMASYISQAKEELTARRLAEYLDSLPLFHDLGEERLLRLAQAAKLRTYFDGDQILMGHDTGQLYFLRSGRVARHMDPGTGWFSLLDAAKEGRLLNETAFLANCRSRIMGEVLSDEATVLTLPLPQTIDLLKRNDDFSSRFFQHILGEMEKYQRRWVSN